MNCECRLLSCFMGLNFCENKQKLKKVYYNLRFI
uniref:Uncharacterized protein n=1 Tax=Rhizophora mucronata TaxID=61149 RepID=A0A2P2R5C9_RHIMU